MARRLFSIALITALLGGSLACKTGPQRRPSYDLSEETRAVETFDDWFEGDLDASSLEMPPPPETFDETGEEETSEADETDEGPTLDHLLAAAEIYYWRGDVERAFELYARMLRRHPSHPLNRYAAARLYDLRDAVVDFHDRIEPLLSDLPFEDVPALTRVYLSLTGQTVRYQQWESSEENSPFRIDDAGFPSDWQTTPRLSPWRSIDFDRSFAPEEQSQLADTYVAPRFAEDRPVNRDRTTPYRANGLNLSPNFGRRGIYYLETFATVEPTEGEASHRTYWIYGNFAGAARVWIDGKRVLERRLKRYGTGKQLRRIRLEPGTHRILVKLAFEPGYRNWFDLALLGDDATPLSGSGLDFSRTPPDDYDGSAGLERIGETHRPADLEPVRIARNRLDDADDASLYLTALGAYYGQQPDVFEPAWRELMERHGDFAAGHGLRSAQVQTLWEMPSDKRNATSSTRLRRAHELDRDSLYYLTRLAEMLRNRQGSDSEEARDLLEVAKNGAFLEEDDGTTGRLRNVEPLEAWASLLEARDWNEEAERAWRRTLEAAPSHCRAARRLQDLYYGRSYYPPLDEITSAWKRCPSLEDTLIFDRPDRQEARLAHYRQRAKRYPFGAGRQLDWAEALLSRGKRDRAMEVLKQARDRMPESNALWNEIAEMRFAERGREAAIETLQRAIEANGHSETLTTRISTLNNEIPLRELMLDGQKRAMQHLEAGRKKAEGARSSDEAYYVVDYAARQYMPNGSTRTLTHTVVRTMTEGAIDRFGESSIPGNAELLMARTINQDGTVEVPEPQAGKSTLSMPGLDEGDFVELAYVQYGGSPSTSKTHREGIEFFFRMSDISSIHSEYVVLGEEDASFIRQNDPPEAEDFEKAGHEGVRFLRKDSPRPRREPYSVVGTEFLPWIQLYDEGVTMKPFEVDRRYVADRLMSSLDVSRELRKQVREWRSDTEPGTRADIRDLYYDVTDWLSSSSPMAFGRDAAHTLLSKEGSPYVLLQTAYDIAGVESDVYLVKSRYEHPDEFPVGEFAKYRRALMRVEGPGDDVYWIAPSHRDSMFRAISPSLAGQPAVCMTCDELVRKTVPESGFRDGVREVSVDGELSDRGVLSGTAEVTYHGIRAANLRSSLRRTSSETRRRKFMGRVLTGLLPGSSLTDFRVVDADRPDDPLTLELDFERTNFAQSTSDGGWRVQAALFRVPVASAYGKLRTRVRPLLVGRRRHGNYELSVDLPDDMDATLQSQSGEWSADSEYGTFSRSVAIDDGTLAVTSKLELPIQRVSTDAYSDFRKWAIEVERSSRLLLTLNPS
jgi:tetratricopeptide (TPR) repeat protein